MFIFTSCFTQLKILKSVQEGLTCLNYVIDSEAKQFLIFGRFEEGFGFGYKEVFNEKGEDKKVGANDHFGPILDDQIDALVF